MKNLLLLVCLGFFTQGYAQKGQDTVKIETSGRNVVTIVEGNSHHPAVSIGDQVDIKGSGKHDTLRIRVGGNALYIYEGDHHTDIRFKMSDHNDLSKKSGRPSRFEGHWADWELGVNTFSKVDYTGFTPNFLDLRQSKSLEVGFHFIQEDIPLQKARHNLGLVTGLGLTYNDYRFANPITIKNNGGVVEVVPLDPAGLAKSKLSTVYLTLPVVLEYQFPSNRPNHPFYLAGGMIGGVKVGSHTKVKQNGIKTKSHGEYDLNPFRYGATARIGYDRINLFGTWYFTDLFRSGRGPACTPFTIGMGFMLNGH